MKHIVLWHDSQNIDGQNNTTLADGQLITDWFDKSGSGFTTTSTNAPEFNESENALYFNGNIYEIIVINRLLTNAERNQKAIRPHVLIVAGRTLE